MDNQEKTAVTIYTPESQMSSPGLLLRALLKDIKDSRDLAWRLTVRDISARYRQSYFGIAWAFIPPILTAVVFIVLQKMSVVNFGEFPVPYPVYVLAGTVLWQTFTEALNMPLQVVNTAKPMLAKISFAREALLLSGLYQVLFNFAIKLVLLLVALPILGGEFYMTSILFLLPAILLIVGGLVIGTLLTPLGMLYTDVGSSISVIVQFLFFLTPVVYAPPTTWPFNLIMYLNPVAPVLVGARELLVMGSISNLPFILLIAFLTILFGFFALIIFRLSIPILIERISS